MAGPARQDGGLGRSAGRRVLVGEVVFNGLLLAAVPALLLFMAWIAYWAWGPRPVLAVMVGLVAIMRLVATRFSRAVLRAFLVAAIVVSVGALLSVGRTERIRARARASRAAATGLAVESAEVRAEVGPTTAADAGVRSASAVTELRRLAPRPTTPDAAPSVASDLAGELEADQAGDPTAAAVRRATDLQGRLLVEPELSAAGGANGALVRQAAATIEALRRFAAVSTLDRADRAIGDLCRTSGGTVAPDPACQPDRAALAAGEGSATFRRQLAADQARAGLLVAEAADAGGRVIPRRRPHSSRAGGTPSPPPWPPGRTTSRRPTSSPSCGRGATPWSGPSRWSTAAACPCRWPWSAGSCWPAWASWATATSRS